MNATTATRSEANAVYAAGLVQGIVLVTFPAARTPQVITAIVASLLGINAEGKSLEAVTKPLTAAE
jgi:hypothetical protein